LKTVVIGNEPSYVFKLWIGISKENFFNTQREPICIKITEYAKAINLKVFNNNLLVSGFGFSTKEEASKYHHKIKDAVFLTGLKRKFGFNINEEFLPGESRGLVFQAKGLPGAGFDINDIFKEYNKEIVNNLSPKQSLALELFNMSYFETSSRASFITLITAIECLVRRDCRPQFWHLLIDCINNVNKLQDDIHDDKESFKNGLRWLGLESIARSCRKLVGRLLSRDDVKKFDNFYKIRSELIHNGTTRDNINIGITLSQLREMVHQLLIRDIFQNELSI
jgi:hypothetical protein